jgi:hypothetical protein
MCMDDLSAARERAHDPYKLGRFCDEMDAFRLYTGKNERFHSHDTIYEQLEVEAATSTSILNALQSIVNMLR